MPTERISVPIADDHRLFAEALEVILGSEPAIEVATKERIAAQLVQVIRELAA